VRHVAVDDCGRILNPLLVTGQQHGGLAQGIAQALYEVRFDADGQPLTGTLVDYHIPSAADLITFETANTETPTPLNALGAKGIGESATIGSTRRCRTRWWTRWPRWGAPHRPAVHARAGVAGDRRRPGRSRGRPCASRPRCSPGCPCAAAARRRTKGRSEPSVSGARWTSCCAAEADCET
jgi:hypothetical protein